MADFDLPNVRALTRAIKKTFAATKPPKEKYKSIATVVKIDSHTADYAWLADMPSMKKWIAERDLKMLEDRQYSIEKEDWEASVSVKRDDFLFDRLGLVKPKIEQLKHSVVKHYNSMVHGAITANGLCYDGEPFFGTHPVGTKTYNTKGTAALSEQALFDVIAMMSSVENEEGEPLEVEPSTLLIAPNLLRKAKQTLGSAQINGTDNVALNLLELEVVQKLPANAWCVLDTTQPLKPFILQITKEGEVEEDSADMFKLKRVNYGIDTMDQVGYGFWQMAYYSDGTAA